MIKNDVLHYYRRDHLGHVREVWKSNTATSPAVQRMQYYPSGLPWVDCMGADYQNRKYNGKEFIEMHGLDRSHIMVSLFVSSKELKYGESSLSRKFT